MLRHVSRLAYDLRRNLWAVHGIILDKDVVDA